MSAAAVSATSSASATAELRKVEWPGRRQLVSATVVVIIAIAVVGAYLAVADFVFSRLVRDVLLAPADPMFRWYVINTYSGHENKVKANLEHRIVSMGQQPRFRRVVVPTEQRIETKDGQRVQTEQRVLPGYVLVNMDMSDEAWGVVKNTPGVTGFVGAGRSRCRSHSSRSTGSCTRARPPSASARSQSSSSASP